MPGPRVPPHLHLFRGLTGALLLTILIILTLGPAVFARELLGQASVIDGDTWKSSASVFEYLGSMRRRRISFVVMNKARTIAADRRHPMRCSISLIVVPSNASK